MSSELPHEGDEARPLEPSQIPVLRGPTPHANWRFTALALAGLAALAVLRLVATHPAPSPSHGSPQGAVAGYLAAVRSGSARQLERFLAPAQRSGAGNMLADLKRDRVRLVSPAIGAVSLQGSSAQVQVALEICYRAGAKDPYTCRLLVHEPLGLASEIVCRRVGGAWYVSTLLDPQPLGG